MLTELEVKAGQQAILYTTLRSLKDKATVVELQDEIKKQLTIAYNLGAKSCKYQ